MSGLICECNEPVKNLGTVSCIDKFGKPLRLTFVPIYKDDGTENYIDTATAALDQTYFDGLQYNTDTNQRFYPVPVDLKNVEMTKGDPVYEEFDDGTKQFVRFGARTFSAVMPDIAPVYIGKLNSKKCGKIGVYITSDTKNFGGIEKSKGKLYPMQLADSTLNNVWTFATGSTNEKGAIAFEFHSAILDEQFSWINKSDIGIDMLTQWKGKLDTNIVQVGSGSATGFTVDVYSDFGTVNSKLPVEGLVTADFSLYNDTGSASITITSATESTTVPGRYVLVVPTQTTTDDATLSLSSSTAAKPFADGTWSDVVISFD